MLALLSCGSGSECTRNFDDCEFFSDTSQMVCEDVATELNCACFDFNEVLTFSDTGICILCDCIPVNNQ